MDQGWLELLFFNYSQLSLDQRRQVLWVTEATSQVHHQYPSPEERAEKMKLFLDFNPRMAATAAELFHGTSLLPSATGGPSDSGLATNSNFFQLNFVGKKTSLICLDGKSVTLYQMEHCSLLFLQ